jgi:hypothetical protein
MLKPLLVPGVLGSGGLFSWCSDLGEAGTGSSTVGVVAVMAAVAAGDGDPMLLVLVLLCSSRTVLIVGVGRDSVQPCRYS